MAAQQREPGARLFPLFQQVGFLAHICCLMVARRLPRLRPQVCTPGRKKGGAGRGADCIRKPKRRRARRWLPRTPEGIAPPRPPSGGLGRQVHCSSERCWGGKGRASGSRWRACDVGSAATKARIHLVTRPLITGYLVSLTLSASFGEWGRL